MLCPLAPAPIVFPQHILIKDEVAAEVFQKICREGLHVGEGMLDAFQEVFDRCGVTDPARKQQTLLRAFREFTTVLTSKLPQHGDIVPAMSPNEDHILAARISETFAGSTFEISDKLLEDPLYKELAGYVAVGDSRPMQWYFETMEDCIKKHLNQGALAGVS